MTAVVFGLLAATATAVFIVDPLQVFRKAELYAPVVIADERTQNAGIIRNYPADSLIIGSSISQACRPDEFERLLGGRFIRISSAGLTAREMRLYLDLRLERHRPERVYDIEYWYTFARENAADFREEFGEFPQHLYRLSPFEAAKYLINFDNIGITRSIIAESLGFDRIERTPLALRNSPEIDPKRRKGRDSVMKLYRQITTGPRPAHAFIVGERTRMLSTLQSLYEPVLAANQDVEFHIVIPPFSTAYYQAFAKAGVYRLNTILLFREKVAELKEAYPNVRIHDFGADFAAMSDFGNYFDTHHFSEAVCTRMAARIAARPSGDSAPEVRSNTQKLKQRIATAPPPA